MKKIILALSVLSLGLFASTAYAQDCRWGVDHKHPSCFHRVDYRHHGHRGPVIIRESGGWVAPLVGGVVLGAVIAEANRPTIVQPPVVVQQPPVVYQPLPLLQQPPAGYHWQEMIDPVTGERKIVAVPN